jgi:peptidoglycan hydrolase-like protein with peptidoglycan-binding domain
MHIVSVRLRGTIDMTTFRAHRSRRTVSRAGVSLALVVGVGLGGAGLAGGGSAVAADANASIVGLREGSTGAGVRVVEESLVGRGYVIPGGPDELFGSSTTRALRHFQEASGLNPTGVVTENTVRLLGLSATVAAGNTTSSASGSSSPEVSTTPPASPTSYVGLRRGSTGEAVRQVQLKLLALQLYLNGGADGVFGPSTENAVILVQRVNGLPETGVVTEQVAAILGLTGSASTPSTPAPAGTVPQYGSTGEAVRRVQQLLIDAGINVVGGADGIFGLNTQRAVRTFQQANGLSVTGQVDSATDAALVAAAANGGSSSGSASGSGSGSSSPSGSYVGMRIGSTGANVRRVQQAIMASGIYLRGGADGIFGNSTHNGLVAYQKAKGLGATGVVDQATVQAMGLGTSTSSGGSGLSGGGSTAAGYAVYDERGARVVALQRALLNAGIPVGGGADGVFGSMTLGAVRAFQQARGLPATGKVDQATANALGLAPIAAPAAPATPVTVTLQARPVAGTCYYGDTWQAPRGGGRFHLGVDIGAAENTPLRAVVSGRVIQMYHDQAGSLSGNGLKIATADGTYYFYAHLAGFADGISVGTTVTAGQVIGYLGRTGNAGVPHLHFEVHPGGGAAVNPYPILRASGACP